METDRTGRFNLDMPRDADPFEIADLVARAERVKRNRETIVRTFQPKPLLTPALLTSPDGRLSVYLRVGGRVPESKAGLTSP